MDAQARLARLNNAETIRKARLVYALTWAIAPWGPIFGLLHLWMFSDRWIAVALILTGVLASLTHVLLEMTKSIALAGNYLTVAFYAVVMLCAVTAGDRPTASLVWLSPLPLMAVCLVGKRSGVTWAVVSALTVFVFLVLEEQGKLPPAPFTRDMDHVLIAAGIIGLISIGAAYATFYESLRDRTLTQLEIQRAKSYQSAKMAALGEMASGIAHEINNPLTVIRLQADHLGDLLEEGNPTREQLQQISRRIATTTSRIAKIIRGLRGFSRNAESEPLVEASLPDVLRETLQFCEEKFRGNEVALEVKVPAETRTPCRPVQISQVLLNLLNNSYDAVASLEGNKWIKLEVQDDQDFSRLIVSDSGKGIPREIRERLFHPFFTTKSPDQGTGLGLSVSKGIIESHQGTLLLDETAENTTFVITLPKATWNASDVSQVTR